MGSNQGTDVDIYLPKYGHTMLPFRPLDSKISALYFVAGDTATRLDGTRVNDVFQSQNGVFCEIKGHTCNRQGYCDPIENGLLDGEGGTVMSQQKGDFARAYSGGVVAKEISSADEAKRTMNSLVLETNITAVAGLVRYGCRCAPGYIGEYCEGTDPPQSSATTLQLALWPLFFLLMASYDLIPR